MEQEKKEGRDVGRGDPVTKSYTLFLGCYVPAVQPFVEVALRKIAPLLDLKLMDVPGATCCPSPDILRLSDHDAWLRIAARNLALAESNGHDIMVLCNGCWDTLYEAREELLHDSALMDEVNSSLAPLNKTLTGSSKVRHFVEIVAEDVGFKKLANAVKQPLSQLITAVHYGCKFFKSENEIFATYFDEITKNLDLDIHEYGAEKVCCGLPFSYNSLERAIENRTKWKLEKIQAKNVDCLVTICPGCYDFLEKAQLLLRRKGSKFDIPLLNLIELMALAFGFSPQEIGVNRHRIKVKPVIEKLGFGGS